MISLLDPLEQFYVVNVLEWIVRQGSFAVFVFSNFWLMSWFIFALFAFYLKVFSKKSQRQIIFSSWNIIFMQYCFFIKTLLQENFVSRRYFFAPYVFTLFTLIFAANITGMVPFSFALTSHLLVTFFFSFVTFCTSVCIGLQLHGSTFFVLFLPNGSPFLLSPLLILLECISFFARLFSLAIRLFANIMSGHTLLKILTGFIWLLLVNGSFLVILPFFVVYLVNILEIIIGFLQAYVFTTLSCFYLNEALVLH